MLDPQALTAFTVTVPLVYDAGSVTFMELVPRPELITDPVGTVQSYEVAPLVETVQV